MIESAIAAVGLSSGFHSSPALLQYRPIQCIEDGGSCFNVASRRISHSHRFNVVGNGFLMYNGDYLPKKHMRKNRTQAIAEHLDSASDPDKQNGRSSYHPSEDIRISALQNTGDAARLTPAETTRTIVEVNSKGTLMLTGLVGDGVHENILWPDLPYIKDKHGNIYFQVEDDEDILRTITLDNNYVQVILGFDTMEMIKEMELLGSSEIDFGIEEFEDEEDEDDDKDEDEDEDEEDEEDEGWVAVLQDEDDGEEEKQEGEEEEEEEDDDDDDDDDDSDESLGDWANLETMRSSHPMYFARKMAEVASDNSVDWMDQPSAGLAIQGLLSPVPVEDSSDIQKHITRHKSLGTVENEHAKNLEEKLEDVGASGDESELQSSDENARNGPSLYKLDMIKIQLITAQGQQTEVEVEEFRKAQPDAIAHASADIIRRLEESSEKLTEALRSLCWRNSSIQAEEVKLIGIDSLGFDLRICSGTQIQTLRYAFSTRATSECSAEKQLKELLFTKMVPMP